jgi:hypothetical protein
MAKKRPRPPIDPRAKRRGKRPDARTTPQVQTISDIDEQFCRLYLKNGLNATEAYRRSHPRASSKTANVEGCRILAKPSVQAWLVERLQPTLDDEMTAARVVEEMRRRAFADRTGIYDEHGKLLHPKQWPRELRSLLQGVDFNDDGSVKKVKLAGGDKALELAAKYNNLIVDRSVAVDADLDLGSMTVDEIERKLRAVMTEMTRSHEGDGGEE